MIEGSFMPSCQISDYKLGPVLGIGTVGTIYAAVDPRTGDKVAIKRLHPGISQDDLIRARFRREMLVLQRLNHPNIVHYYGGGDDDGNLFYVMELVDGGTVKELLQVRGSLQWPVVAEIARQVCSALQCAHNHGVVHRDLKPGNLFLTREGEVKLGDFGIARDLKSTNLTSNGMTVGTHAYMAPEQITGDTSISGKADLYSLGCCLFEMLVGRQPYQGENFAQLFEQHFRAPPPSVRDFVADCPQELDEIVQKLLAKNPDDRPFNARQVQGLMSQLEDAFDEHEASESAADDVAADQVGQRARQLLKQQIELELGRTPPSEVGGRKLAVMAVAIVAIIVAASLLVK
jgi:serine/threonine protein kinase